ncbi:hypothetical protein GXW82_01225 [Streptacidiphilus sp. 4-A2]|nr:hypothetical protein [Streptacidiphilus sp. 4-A2]
MPLLVLTADGHPHILATPPGALFPQLLRRRQTEGGEPQWECLLDFAAEAAAADTGTAETAPLTPPPPRPEPQRPTPPKATWSRASSSWATSCWIRPGSTWPTPWTPPAPMCSTCGCTTWPPAPPGCWPSPPPPPWPGTACMPDFSIWPSTTTEPRSGCSHWTRRPAHTAS